MKPTPIDSTIQLVENYTECWKQMNHYLALARTRKFEADDDAQFLEIKSILAQQLELVLAAVRCPFPTREEVHKLLADLPSLRYLGDVGDDTLRSVESRWHRIYIGWQSILGQMKVKQQERPARSFTLRSLLTRATQRAA